MSSVDSNQFQGANGPTTSHRPQGLGFGGHRGLGLAATLCDRMHGDHCLGWSAIVIQMWSSPPIRFTYAESADLREGFGFCLED